MIRALVGQRVRRDRVQLLFWILGTLALAGSAIGGVERAYGTESDRVEILATVMANPVILLFRGLPSGAEQQAFTLFLILPFLAMMAAFLSTFLAVRHTRAEEESGRAETVGAAPAGRLAPLVATFLHGTAANLVLACLIAVEFLLAGYEVAGSLVAGLAIGVVGIVFLGVGLIAGQLLHTARAANSLAVWVLLGTFVLSGIGNALGTPSADLRSIESSWPAWLSPFGWAENTRPFATDSAWPAVLALGVGALLAAIAGGLQWHRDLGESALAARIGRASAPAALSTPGRLGWRLTRGSTAGWMIGALVTGLLATSLASVIETVGTRIPSIEALTDALTQGGGLAQGMVVVFFTIVGVLAAGAAVQTVCRARQEEAHGTAEPVLAAPVGRVSWLTGYLGNAFLAAFLVTSAAVLGAILGVAARNGEWSLVRDALIVGAGQLAAASVHLALTALVLVVAPRLTIPLGWALVVGGLVLGLFGTLLGMPDWLVHLAPVADGPTLAGDDVQAGGAVRLVAIAAAGVATACVLMRSRPLAAAG